jgi:hypothetical protein
MTLITFCDVLTTKTDGHGWYNDTDHLDDGDHDPEPEAKSELQGHG